MNNQPPQMSDAKTPTLNDAEKYYSTAAVKFEKWFEKTVLKLRDEGFGCAVESILHAKPEMKLAYSNAYALKDYEVDILKKELERLKKELIKAYDVILHETQLDYAGCEGKEPEPNEKFKEMFPLMIELKGKGAQ